MNRTEAAYARDVLDARRAAGEVLAYYFEPLKFRLAPSTYYSPDFMVVLADLTVEFHETKAAHIEDDAIVKLKVAARLYPFRFRLCVRRRGGGWDVSRVGGEG